MKKETNRDERMRAACGAKEETNRDERAGLGEAPARDGLHGGIAEDAPGGGEEEANRGERAGLGEAPAWDGLHGGIAGDAPGGGEKEANRGERAGLGEAPARAAWDGLHGRGAQTADSPGGGEEEANRGEHAGLGEAPARAARDGLHGGIAGDAPGGGEEEANRDERAGLGEGPAWDGLHGGIAGDAPGGGEEETNRGERAGLGEGPAWDGLHGGIAGDAPRGGEEETNRDEHAGLGEGPARAARDVLHGRGAQTADSPRDEAPPGARYEAFLRDITGGDPDLYRYLQRLAGMALVGGVFDECVILCYGPGGNGKSTLFGLWLDVLGDYAATIRPELLVPRREGAEPFGLEQVRGRRLVVAAETDPGLFLNQSVLKRLSSQDHVSANPKGRDPFSFRPSHTLVLHTNHLPRIRALDGGTRRRIAVLPLHASLPRARMITDLRARLLRSDGPYILRWMIRGAQAFCADGLRLRRPAAVRNASQAYFDGEDWFAAFFAACCLRGGSAASADLLRALHDWEAPNPLHDSRELAAQLRAHGFRLRHTRTGNLWDGLSLAPNPLRDRPRGDADGKSGEA